MTDDTQLLERFAARGDEDAFRALIDRHLDLVYSAALRLANGDAPLAEDVAQSVFTDLARKARELPRDTVLAGWLYEAARFAAAKAIRGERRRQAREQEALTMQDTAANPATETAPDWEQLRPVLDAAMGELSAPDRNAILLRYFQNQDFHAVGLALGVSDDAAQKRVSRAVDRLREFLGKPGVTLGAHGLVVVIAANAIQAAPAGLSAAIAVAALTGTTLITAATVTVGKGIAMTTAQKVLITAALAAAVGTGIYEAREASTLRTEVQTLRQQPSQPTEQTQQLTKDRDDALRQLTALRTDNERLARDTVELLKLRGEVSLLRASAKELTEIKSSLSQNTNDRLHFMATMWAKNTKALKERLSQMPQLNIPEMSLLDDFAWLRLADGFADVDDDDEVREFAREARTKAKELFAHLLRAALLKYAEANDGQTPKQLLDLKPYFRIPGDKPPGARPLDESILQRYELVQGGKLADAPGRKLVVEKRPVEKDDTVFAIGPDGYTTYHVTPGVTEREEHNFVPPARP